MSPIHDPGLRMFYLSSLFFVKISQFSVSSINDPIDQNVHWIFIVRKFRCSPCHLGAVHMIRASPVNRADLSHESLYFSTT